MREGDFTRVVASLVAHELAETRRTSALAEPLVSINAETELSERSLGVDSLELLQVAGVVNEFFQLHEYSVQDYLLQYRSVGQWAQVAASAWRAGPPFVTFRTSGSTGAPKRIRHSLAFLAREVADHARYFAGARRILSAVPAHHIYGFLFTALLPAHLAAEVVDVRRWSPHQWQHQAQSGDLIVAAPAFWHYLSRSIERFPDGVRGVTSSAPCPTELAHRLIQQGLDWTDVYGSSETAGIGRRCRPTDPYELLPYWKRGDAESLHDRPADGSAAKPQSFAVMDRLDWVTEHAFVVVGRIDGAVQVGGVNVFPQRVAARLAEHPQVKACAVRPMRPEEGARLKAFVVWREPAEASLIQSELRAWCAEHLPAPERPTTFTVGTSLPTNGLGKPQDWHVDRN